MGNARVHSMGPARLITIAAAVGLMAAALALGSSGWGIGGATFRDTASHHLKLTGVVGGIVTCDCGVGRPLPHRKITLRKGTKKVGTWALMEQCLTRTQCDVSGTGNMKIGRLKGKVSVSYSCATHSGTVSQTGKPSEGVRLRGKCPPSLKKGKHFKFTLSY